MDEAFADRRGLLEFCQWRVLPEPMDGFGKITRELVFETKATERRMLSKETAAKERDRLYRLEREHVLRMHRADVDDIDNSDDAGLRKSKKGKKRAKKGQTRSLS
ncbi:unnamed protein product [Peronospora farinosa]|uniref:Uncharacterized protein n=1 Tax=Peronospora farinosa TaxID=134698 RepID=A0ABN8C5K9_9STRA|nr:unnamed protein product [Peronospora farinosa]